MSNYTPLVNYAAKDALTTGNPSKKILGTEISAELSAIATAIGTKEDTANKGIANGYVGMDSNSVASAGGYTVTGSTVPANGIYLPSANTVGLATNSTLRTSVDGSGNVIFRLPTTSVFYAGVAGSTNNPRVELTPTESSGNIDLNFTGSAVAGTASIKRFGTSVIDISSARNVTIGAPSSGNTLTVNGTTGVAASVVGSTGASATIYTGYNIGHRSSAWNIVAAGEDLAIGSASASGGLYLHAGNAQRVAIGSAGNITVGAPTSGATFDIDGVTADQIVFRRSATARGYIGADGGGLGMFGSASQAGGGFYVTPTSAQIYSGASARLTVNSAGNISTTAPSSGDSFSVAAVSGSGITVSSSDLPRVAVSAGTVVGSMRAWAAGSAALIGTQSAHAVNLRTNDADRVVIGSAGNVSVAAPSSGTALTVTGVSAGTAASFGDGSRNFNIGFAASRVDIGPTTTDTLSLLTSGTRRVEVSSAGAVTINSPTSGAGLTVNGLSGQFALNVNGVSGGPIANFIGVGNSTYTQWTRGASAVGYIGSADAVIASGSSSDFGIAAGSGGGLAFGVNISDRAAYITSGGILQAEDQGGTLQDVGWRDMPQSTNTSLVLSDRGKHIYLTGTTNTVTIPANGSVAFPTGTTIVLVNDGSGNTTLNITTDTLEWFQGGASSTGSRTIATKSMVTLVKVTSTKWVITGAGIS